MSRVAWVIVHSALPPGLTDAVGAMLDAAGIAHVAHGDGDPLRAASRAAGDPAAIALIGPYRSAAVAEALEVTAPSRLPLLAPVASWAGVTRDGRRALVVAGDHDYGRQLDGQLRLAKLPRTDDASAADLILFAGLAGDRELGRVQAGPPVPVIAFDGVQGARLDGGREWCMALPTAPVEGIAPDDLHAGVEHARRAARLVVAAVRDGARERASVLRAPRVLAPFDEHGDPVDPPVWLWRVLDDWSLRPDRAL